jgi:hypothetical protein
MKSKIKNHITTARLVTAAACFLLAGPAAPARDKTKGPGDVIKTTPTPRPVPKPTTATSSSAQKTHSAAAKPHDTPKPVSSKGLEKEVRTKMQTDQSLRREMLNAAKANDLAAAKASLAKAGVKDIERVQVARFRGKFKVCVVIPLSNGGTQTICEEIKE